MKEGKNQREGKCLESLLLDGLKSGEPVQVTKQYVESRRHTLRKRLKPGNALGDGSLIGPIPHSAKDSKAILSEEE